MFADAVTKQIAQEKFTVLVNAMMIQDSRLNKSGRLEEHEARRYRSE